MRSPRDGEQTPLTDGTRLELVVMPPARLRFVNAAAALEEPRQMPADSLGADTQKRGGLLA